MESVLAYQSSEVDWCEDNFQFSEEVAEFYNTVSSASFFIFAPIMMYLLHPYAKERTHAVHLVWLMMMIVGVFSAYYHMTLSYMGQLLDELSILWVLAIGYTLWFPRHRFPFFIKDRCTFAGLVFFTATLSTVFSFAKPTVNAYALNSITLHILYVLCQEMKSCTDPQIQRLAFTTVAWWALAISCWLSDRLLCGFWRRINFCYLHSFWHILISVASAHGCTLFAYFDAQYEIPFARPEVHYWPGDKWKVALPYLSVNYKTRLQKQC
ncbi:alkaline ceramidase 1 [Erpetoichthys calabaricus]|uniref:alkaline ceramidase 1 n=1 Tax=Erpetoichthys calabaricus TaxID=27687 RepID=UPI002234A82F|nr:alkaline ceramidase 1 [Erpetoichthys calabaricus]